MIELLIVLVVVIWLMIKLTLADKFLKIAIAKGYRRQERGIYAMCFFLTLIGFLYVAALPDKGTEIKTEKNEATNNCASTETQPFNKL